MKIGILTFYNALNYGAILQMYALQNHLIKGGNDVFILDYKCDSVTKRELPLKIWQLRDKRQVYKFLTMNSKLKKKKEIFDEFLKENFKLFNMESKNDINDIFDKFIVGSDQVWSPEITGMDYTYFLNFVKDDTKKIAYAASFGNNKIDTNNNTMKNLLLKFNSISVREPIGIEYIKEFTNKNCKLVVDPVFLLSKEEWSKFCDFVPPVKEYVLLYFPKNHKIMHEFARKIAKENNCEVIFINNTLHKGRNMKNIYSASPKEFLGWILHAKYVVTGSFHGTAFSILFNKEFYSEAQGEKEIGRIDSLLSSVGLEDRYVNEKYTQKNIDYSTVNYKLNIMINKSKKFLSNSITEKNCGN